MGARGGDVARVGAHHARGFQHLRPRQRPTGALVQRRRLEKRPGVAFHQGVGFLLGEEDSPIGFTAKVVLVTAVYGAILTPIFYPVLRRAAAATHAGRVVRF